MRWVWMVGLGWCAGRGGACCGLHLHRWARVLQPAWHHQQLRGGAPYPPGTSGPAGTQCDLVSRALAQALANQPQVLALGYSERFWRKYRFYCERPLPCICSVPAFSACMRCRIGWEGRDEAGRGSGFCQTRPPLSARPPLPAVAYCEAAFDAR